MNKLIIITILIFLSFNFINGSVRLQNIDDQIKIETEKLKSKSEYQINVKQQLLLDYQVDQNAYSIQLDEVTKDGLVKQITNQRSEDEGDNQSALNFDIPNGCSAYKRDFFIDYVIDTVGPDQDYVTDVIVMPKNRKLYILTQNYMIFEAQFQPILVENNEISLQVEFTTKNQSYASVLSQMSGVQDLEASNTFGFATDDERHAYIITKYGAVSFNSSIDLDDDGFGFTKLNFQKRNEIKDILTSVCQRDYVYVVLGEEGVDIYQINDSTHSINMVYSLLGQLQQNDSQQEINAQRIVINNGLLAVLDTYNGIFFYDITKLPSLVPKIDMEMRLQDVVSFDLKGNTLIIVFDGRIGKVWEVFVDFSKEEYYVNRTYLDEITYTDVRMDKHYAILMSDSAHRIISHSIYKEFTEPSLWKQHRYFNQLGLSQLMLLNYVEETGEFYIQRRSYNVDNQLETHQISFLLGSGSNRFSVHKVSELHTQIRCVSDVQIEKTYQITINSTDCTIDQGRSESIGNEVNSGEGDQYSRNVINPFLQCQRQFNMTFTAKGEILQTQNIGLIFEITALTFLFCCGVGLYQIMNYRLAKKKRLLAEKRWNDLQYQHNMSNIIKDQPESEQTPQPGQSGYSQDASQGNQLQSEQQQQQQQQFNSEEKQKGSNFQIDDDEDEEEEGNGVKYGLDDEEQGNQN